MTDTFSRKAWFAALGLLGGAACATAPPRMPPPEQVSPSSASVFQGASPPAAEPAAIPAPPAPESGWSLAGLIDAGLAVNPETRGAWLAARSAAFSWGVDRAGLYPRVNLSGAFNRSRSGMGAAGQVFERNAYGPALEISWLLLDFGGRRAVIEQARQALLAANWTHNAAIADRVLAVTEAYHRHQAALAALAAQKVVVDEAKVTLEAAEVRRRAGVATLSDVLQARTALARAELVLETDEGRAATTRGELNAAVGWPAPRPLATEPWPADLPVQDTQRDVDLLVAAAVERRPELAALRAQVARAEARVRAVRSEGWPALGFSGLTGRAFYTDPAAHLDTYAAALTLRFPLFTGFAQPLAESRARTDLLAAEARLEAQRRQVELDVFQSFHNARTAARRLATSRTLLDSAARNQEVALGRYKAGAGTIVELLTAQSALEDARAQEVQARADWLNALARLARDAGDLASRTPGQAALAAEVAP